MKLSKKGFTLIEIIVSIAIGSIVLLIAGAIILSSSNFLMTTTEMDMDKRCVDSVVDFVRSEILYATDARLMLYNADNAPTIGDEEGWHCFYVKDKVLYRDDSKVYSNDFYSHKELKFSAKGNYQNGSRVDLFYELWNASHEKTYSTKDTVMLLNVQVTDEIKSEGLFTQQKRELTDTGYALYYRNGVKNVENNNNNNNNFNGTVQDQLQLINPMNQKGIYSDELTYRQGEYVYFNNNWWIWLGNYDACGDEPGSIDKDNAHRWKKISAYWDANSGYQTGDVVIYNKDNSNKNTYYKCISDYTIDKEEVYYPDKNPFNVTIWEELTNYTPINDNLIVTNYKDTNKRAECVAKKLGLGMDGLNDLEANKEILNGISEYNPNMNYQVGDIVKVSIESSGVYDYYLKLFDNLGEPGKRVMNNNTGFEEVGWQLLSTYYDEDSAYVEGDIFYGSRRSMESFFITTKQAGLLNSDYNTVVNPENAGKINIYLPFDKVFNGFSNDKDQYNGYAVPYYNRWFMIY